MTSTVILLNGVSSAGKSTLAKAIQLLADRHFLHVAMDDFIGMLPQGSEVEEAWFPVRRITHSDTILPRVSSGSDGEKLLGAMRQFVGALAEQGLSVIVDEVCHAAEIDDYRTRIGCAHLMVVKVTAPPSEIQRREIARGDRMPGLAEEQATHLHEGIDYDLEIDTGSWTTSDSAQLILKALARKGDVSKGKEVPKGGLEVA